MYRRADVAAIETKVTIATRPATLFINKGGNHEVRTRLACDPPWLVLARGELGTKEAPGEANNPVVLRYYADAGHPEINSESIAWCPAFTGAMLERSGYPGSKSLMARSYLQ